MKKENKKDYLRRILNIKCGNPGYEEMDTLIREYNKFIRTLNFNGYRDGEEEKIFLYFHSHNITVSSIIAKGKGKEKLQTEMREILAKAVGYYKDVLYPEYYEKARMQSPKDFQIEMWDRERIDSVVGNISNIDCFLHDLDQQWNEFTNYLYKTIDLVFNGDYSIKDGPVFLKTDCFEEMVQAEMDYYSSQVHQYSQSLDDSNSIYYVGKNHNPYKNLYLYYLRSYIKNFYVTDIPRVEVGKFYELIHLKPVEEKEFYGLSDIAKIYSEMTGCKYDRAYGKIKQQFRKSQFMQEYKKDGKYCFKQPELPLATYVYYSKKNHNEPEFEKPFGNYDALMQYVYAPLLRANIHNEYSRLNAYNQFYDFITKEFSNALSRTDDAYITTFLETLLQCPMHLFFRCSGLDVNSIIG